MPDRYGFDHLGDHEVRCIDCGEGGPIWRFTGRVRARHYEKHESARRRAAQAHATRMRRLAIRRLKEVNRLRRETR